MENYLLSYVADTGEFTGFYLRSIHGNNIPMPFIEISPEKHDFYMLPNVNGKYKLNPATLEDELIPVPEPMPQPPTELEILKNQVSENQGAIDYIVMNF